MEVSELEHFLLVRITSFAENVRDEGGDSKFVLLDAPRGNGAGRGVEVAGAARVAEAVKEVRRREAAPATRRRATRPAQWYTQPNHSQETPREETAIEFSYTWSLMPFMPRDRVIVKRMTTYWARERQNVIF